MDKMEQKFDILCKLAQYARERTERAKSLLSLDELRERALSIETVPPDFEAAIRKPGLSYILECKKASPSKGLIAEEFPYLDIARDYEEAGADAISVLTEPKWFLGDDSYLEEIASNVSLPCLRKDFTVDPYMIYEARILGASAVLLIAAILSEAEVREGIELAGSLNMSALVEVHDFHELDVALNAGARIVGVNNRNLRDFSVDTENSLKYREHISSDVLFVSESGVSTRSDIERIEAAGADAVLIGESVMRAPDKKIKMRELKGQ